MEKVIEVQNLKKSYSLAKGKSLEALKGISFAVDKSEIFGILGPNGAGKTTTLEIIEGLKRQTTGKVVVLGFDNIKQASEIKQRIGVQLQSSDYLPYLSLKELLELFASLYGLDKNTDVLRPLKLVELEDKKDETVKKLSGGQKQRFTIATSLVHNPEILFLDEPTTGLDPAARRAMWKLIKEINGRGITIVITTHYMEEAEFLCHRVAIMDKGQILEIDEPRKLIDNISQTTQVSFLTDRDLDQSLFSSISEIKKVYSSYPKITLELSGLDKISDLVGLLKKQNIPFSGFTVKTASLEDVYLELTGHEYEE